MNKSINKYSPDNLIQKVEQQWLQQLYAYVKAEFNKTWLPSHDHTHHLRVWSFAKDMVKTLHREGCYFSEAKLEQLIIAVFFHDIGLTRTLDATHGKRSRGICKKFLAGQASHFAGTLDPILEAVEKHDDKSYPENFSTGKELPDDILTLLAVSDDLDAFGATGVFRYLEIYMQRGILLQSIPVKVIKNLEKRYSYLLQNYGKLKDFMHAQQKRYQYTVDFYRELDHQHRSAIDKPANNGPLMVINLLLEKVLRERIHFTEIASNIETLALDAYSMNYFRQLQSELQ